MDSGIEFQMTGPAIENALSPNLILVLGMVQLLLPEDASDAIKHFLTGKHVVKLVQIRHILIVMTMSVIGTTTIIIIIQILK